MRGISTTEAEVMVLEPPEKARAGVRERPPFGRPSWKDVFAFGDNQPTRLGSDSHSTHLAEQQPSRTGSTGSQYVTTHHDFFQDENSLAGISPSDVMPAKPKAKQLAHYRDRKQIPGVKPATYVYRNANGDISMDHQNRFPVIKDVFQQNLHEHSKLSLKHPARTQFMLRMCGSGMHNAQPTILVSHPSNDLKTGQLIMKILTKKQDLGYPAETLGIIMKRSRFPGALLVSEHFDGISTITCGIRFPNIDDTIFALTSAHAFEGDDEGNEGDIQYEETSDTLSAPNEDEEEDGETFEFAGVEYDMTELMNYENIHKQDQISEASLEHREKSETIQRHADKDLHFSQTDSQFFQDDLQNLEAEFIMASRVWGRPKGPEWAQYPNLDWALIEIELDQRLMASVRLHEVPELGDENRAVRIKTSRGVLYGTICNIPAFIANSNSISSLCEVWTVTAAEPNSLQRGDSGALVFDHITGQAYGYVIAVNHFQELYVMPLISVLRQISQMISIPNVKPELFMNVIPNLLPSLGKGDISKELTSYFSQYWPLAETESLPMWFRESDIVYMSQWKSNEETIAYRLLQLASKDRAQASSMYNSSPLITSRQNTSHRSDAYDKSLLSSIYGSSLTDSLNSLSSSYTSRSTLLSGPFSVTSAASTAASSSTRSFGRPNTIRNHHPRSHEYRSSELRAISLETDMAQNSPSQIGHFVINQDSQRQPNRDELDKSYPSPQVPPQDTLSWKGKEMPHLSTSLEEREQRNILVQANRCLSTCVLDLCATYRLPVPLMRIMIPGENILALRRRWHIEPPEDCEWDKWVSHIESLLDNQLIPAEILSKTEAAQLKKSLVSSLGIHHKLKHLKDSLMDDRHILQLISAGIQITILLKDVLAANELILLHAQTEATIQSHTKVPSKMDAEIAAD